MSSSQPGSGAAKGASRAAAVPMRPEIVVSLTEADLARRPDYRLVVEGAVDRRLELLRARQAEARSGRGRARSAGLAAIRASRMRRGHRQWAGRAASRARDDRVRWKAK